MGSWGLRKNQIPASSLGFWTKPKNNGHTLPPCWVHRREEGVATWTQPKCPLELA